MNIKRLLKKYNTGIVLSGGAARGFAHLGVLKALHEHKIVPDIISGVSAGSIVGAFYADGYEPEEILDIFERKKLIQLVNVIFKRVGLFDIKGLKKLLNNNLRAKTFEELKNPLYVAATNLEAGKVEYFSEGSLVDKVVASSSVPVLFKPQKVNGAMYVDGGLLDNLPVEPIKDVCKKIIGVNVSPLEEEPDLNGIKNIAIRSFHINIATSLQSKKKLFDIYIEPNELEKYGYFNIKKGHDLFNIGYHHACKILSEKAENV